MRRAAEHLDKAIQSAGTLLDPVQERHRGRLSDALLDMRIAKALLSVALSVSSEPVPV